MGSPSSNPEGAVGSIKHCMRTPHALYLSWDRPLYAIRSAASYASTIAEHVAIVFPIQLGFYILSMLGEVMIRVCESRCPKCGQSIREERSHYRCERCGIVEACCEGLAGGGEETKPVETLKLATELARQ